MGNLQTLDSKIQYFTEPFKLTIRLDLNTQQLSTINTLILKRSTIKQQHICTVIRLHTQQSLNNSICEESFSAVLQYDHFDYYLSNIAKRFPLNGQQILKIVFNVTSALLAMASQGYRHGDINSAMICCSGSDWRLIDNYFIKAGVTAFEKILEGEGAFISPSQMAKIRYGFLRQSPQISQSDDVFGLGMTCLQMMSGKSSKLCYKSSYISFNQKHMNRLISQIHSKCNPHLCQLVMAMIQFRQKQRITLSQIILLSIMQQHRKNQLHRS